MPTDHRRHRPAPAAPAAAATGPLNRLHELTLAAAGQPIFAILAGAIEGLSRQQARRAISAGLLTLDGKLCNDPAAVPAAGALAARLDLRQGIRTVWLRTKHGGEVSGVPPFTVLHADPDLLIVDKAAGIVSSPDPSAPGGHLAELIRRRWKPAAEAGFIGMVHRLDRETSGCICFALNRDAQRILGAQFAGEAAVRTYRCLVATAPVASAGEVSGRQGRGRDGRRALITGPRTPPEPADPDAPAADPVADGPGVEAVTHWRVLRRFPDGSAELEVHLGTGRTHQIRVAMAAIGCPIWGDRVYARGAVAARGGRLMLHAIALAVDHPREGRRIEAKAPIPPAYAAFVSELEQSLKTRPRTSRFGVQGPVEE
jgi:23S rRNA-/tRNA-specific pseudouridylate synthase